MQNFLEFTWYCDICYLWYILPHVVASWFPRGSDSEDLPAMQETQVQSLGQEDHLEKGMTTHSSILTWRITWTEEPGGL